MQKGLLAIFFIGSILLIISIAVLIGIWGMILGLSITMLIFVLLCKIATIGRIIKRK